jgi:FAD synthetase
VTTAGIVIIGDEILSGKFAEENAAFLIHELRSLGVDLRRIEIIADEVADIASSVRAASARFDFVFTSGGVGPTHDDVTMDGVALAFGVEVVRQPELEAKVRSHYGPSVSEANLRLANVPNGAVLLYGNDKIWPVAAMHNVHILPGVPSLFRRKFIDIRDRFRGHPVTAARLYLNADEGEIAAQLNSVVAQFTDVKFGSYPRFSEIDFKVMITLEGSDSSRVHDALHRLTTALAHVVVRTTEPATVG